MRSNKQCRINRGYSIASVIFLLTIITFSLTAAVMWISFYLNVTGLKLRKINHWSGFYEVLKDKILPEFKKDSRDEFISPYDGWFSELPEEIDDYKVRYYCEDNKIDINYIDFSSFFSVTGDKSGGSSYFNKAVNDTVYSYEDLIKIINSDNSDDKSDEIKDIIGIYLVPNVNTASIEKIKKYFFSIDADPVLAGQFAGIIAGYRKNADYLKFAGAKNKKGGLIIDEFEFENLNRLNWNENSSVFEFFDYRGRINLNFVSEEVFKIAFKACVPKNYKFAYRHYWDKIAGYRHSKRTINEGDYKNIFQNDWKRFEKIFSVTSNHFKIEIIKDDKILTVYLRRYKTREMNLKILKISAGRYEEKK